MRANSPARQPIFVAGNGNKLQIDGTTSIKLRLASREIDHVLRISPKLPFDAIIGADLLSALDATLEFRNHVLRLDHKRIQLRGSDSCLLVIEDDADDEDPLADGDPDIRAITINPNLHPTTRKELEALIAQYAALFLPADGSHPCKFPPFKIDTGDARPISSRPFRIPYSERDIIEKEVAEYLRRGWIRPSNSDWASPTLIVRRLDKVRLCIDYRRINAVTRSDKFPSPDIRDCIERRSGRRYFTLIDADSAYHQ